MPTDTISILSLTLSPSLGPDCWTRTRAQPAHLSVHLHLASGFLDGAGESDEVGESVHYGMLAKVVEGRVRVRGEGEGYKGVREMLDDVTDAAFTFVDSEESGGIDVEKVEAVRVVVGLPKLILLADRFEVEMITPVSVWAHRRALASPSASRSDVPTSGLIVRVSDLVLPVLVGVNPPERLAKQRVVTHLTFHESAGSTSGDVNYSKIITDISTDIEKTAYFTLEKLVLEIIKTAFKASEVFESITVCCQKPSALSFARASAVEMTRRKEDVVRGY